MSYVSYQPMPFKTGRPSLVPVAPAYRGGLGDAGQPLRYVVSQPLRYRTDSKASTGSAAAATAARGAAAARFMTATSIPTDPNRRRNLMPLYQQPAAAPEPAQMLMMIPTTAPIQQHQQQRLAMMPNMERVQLLHHPGPQRIVDYSGVGQSENPYHMVPYGSSNSHSSTCTII